MRLKCNKCGKSVSTEVSKETIVRAWLECPECIEKQPIKEVSQEKCKEGYGEHDYCVNNTKIGKMTCCNCGKVRNI